MKYPIRLLTYAWEGRYVSSVQAGIALVQRGGLYITRQPASGRRTQQIPICHRQFGRN